MKLTRKHFVATLIIFAVMAPVMAGVGFTPSASAEFSFVACFPTEEYLSEQSPAAFRSSLAAGVDIAFISIGSEHFDFSFGTSLLYVTRSLPSGSSVLRPYAGIGIFTEIDLPIKDIFILLTGIRYIRCSFAPLPDSFMVFEAFAGPSFPLIKSNSLDFRISSPLTLSFKRDAVSLRLGVAFTVGVAP